MKTVQNMISELREKRLWPVAAALLLALIAVPVLLSSSSKPVALVPTPAVGSANVPALPAVSVTTTPSNARLSGPQRNPFIQQVKANSSTTGSSSRKSAGSTGGSTSNSATSSTSSASTTTSTATTIPTRTPPSAPIGLTATQAYDVELGITNSAGGVNTVDPLERLSVLPSDQQPLLVELGVLKGGRRVLFAVLPGASVSGPGTCIPGLVDCQILSLPEGQTELVSTQSATATVPVAVFAVTGITAHQYSSAGAADKARATVSGAGSRLIHGSTLSALSLFRYDSSLGAMVDLRDLTVGGS